MLPYRWFTEKWVCIMGFSKYFDPQKLACHCVTSVGFDEVCRICGQALSSIKAFSKPTATLQQGRDPDYIQP